MSINIRKTHFLIEMLDCAWLCLNNSSSHSKADFIVLEKAWKCWLELDLSCLTWLESFGWTWLLIERCLTEKLSQIEKSWQSSNLQISLIYVLDTTWSSLTVLYSALHCLGLLDDRCHLTDFSSSGLRSLKVPEIISSCVKLHQVPQSIFNQKLSFPDEYHY